MNTNQENYTGQGARARVSDNQDPQRYAGTEENIINTPKNASGQDDSDDFLKNDQDGFYPNDHNNAGVERSQNTNDDDDFIINGTDDDDDFIINGTDDDDFIINGTDDDDDFIINSTDSDNTFDDEENFNDQESDNGDLNRLGRDTDVNRNQDDSIFGGTNRNESL
ncbi:MAG TPA: hypothetical protein VF677_14395 [Flavobacterium sp.]|jgi:hypothetical protein